MSPTQALARVPEYAGDLLELGALEAYAAIPPQERRIALDANWMAILCRRHQSLRASYILDFLHQAQLTGADPRRREIYLVTRKSRFKDSSGRWQEEEVATTVFAYQFFLSRAKATGRLKRFDVHCAVEEYFNPMTGKVSQVLVAIARVWTRDQEEPIVYRARWPEFVQLRRDDNGGQVATGQWASKPHLMLEKCALANALRWAFPETMAGMYISEEMPEGEHLRMAEAIAPAAAAPAPAASSSASEQLPITQAREAQQEERGALAAPPQGPQAQQAAPAPRLQREPSAAAADLTRRLRSAPAASASPPSPPQPPATVSRIEPVALAPEEPGDAYEEQPPPPEAPPPQRAKAYAMLEQVFAADPPPTEELRRRLEELKAMQLPPTLHLHLAAPIRHARKGDFGPLDTLIAELKG